MTEILNYLEEGYRRYRFLEAPEKAQPTLSHLNKATLGPMPAELLSPSSLPVVPRTASGFSQLLAG
jgi:hypothetical protein